MSTAGSEVYGQQLNAKARNPKRMTPSRVRSVEKSRLGTGSKAHYSRTFWRAFFLVTLLSLSAFTVAYSHLQQKFCISCLRGGRHIESKSTYLPNGVTGSSRRLRLFEYPAQSASVLHSPGSEPSGSLKVLSSDVTPPIAYKVQQEEESAPGVRPTSTSQAPPEVELAINKFPPLRGEVANQSPGALSTDTNSVQKPSRDSPQELSQVTVEESLQEQSRPLVIAVTPTFNRPAQAVHITQIVNLLRVIPPPLLWIVVESYETTEETRLLLARTAGRCMHVGMYPRCTTVNYTHISSGVHHENHGQSRGVNQRNAALAHIEANRIEGIIYFMDDDNSYSPQLFEELRKVQKVGVLPVGFLWSQEAQHASPRRNFKPFVERPLVKVSLGAAHVIGWETFEWAARMDPKVARKFQTDMAGFAFNSRLLWEPTNQMTGHPRHPVRFKSRPAYIETMFLDRLVASFTELEPLADNCQDVLVWHTRTEAFYTDPYPQDWRLPQPKDFEVDEHLNHTARYVVKRRRVYLPNQKGPLAFGYKHMANFEPKKSMDSKKASG